MQQIIELTLDAIAHGGEAIGRHAGKVVFVPYAIPGERVAVEILEEKERWARGRLLRVLQPSPDRVEPPCPYFGQDLCGGCQWQHIAYERQAELKQEIVVDQLRRLGRLAQPPVADILAIAAPADVHPADASAAEDRPAYLAYGYLNQLDLVVDREGRISLRRANGRDLIAVETCLLANDRLDQLQASLDVAWPELEGIKLRASEETDDALVLFQSSAEDQPELEIDLPAAVAVRTVHGVQPLIGDPFLYEEVNGRRYRVSATSYFPANTAGAAALVDTVLAYAGVGLGDAVLDAYCGVGLYSIPLADAGGHVTGLESSPAACEDFAANAGERENVELHEGVVEEILPVLVAAGQRVDVIVLDPPRAGAGPEVLRDLAALGPRRIVYVASDPASLARDGVHLAAAGYRLVEAQPVDLFPQTCRVETVSLWER